MAVRVIPTIANSPRFIDLKSDYYTRGRSASVPVERPTLVPIVVMRGSRMRAGSYRHLLSDEASGQCARMTKGRSFKDPPQREY